MLHGAGIATDLLAADEAVRAAAFDDQLCGSEVPPIFVFFHNGLDVCKERFEFIGWHGVLVLVFECCPFLSSEIDGGSESIKCAVDGLGCEYLLGGEVVNAGTDRLKLGDALEGTFAAQLPMQVGCAWVVINRDHRQECGPKLHRIGQRFDRV